jgi:hypothetical protein
MHWSTVRRALPAGVLVLAWVVLPGAAPAAPAGAAATASESRPRGESPAEKVRKVLDQVAETIEITDQPLELAVAQFHELTKLNFVLDRLTIQQMGVDPGNAAVNLKLQNVKWKSALRTMLGQYNLNYAIVGETVIVTSEDMAMVRQMRQRVSVDLERVQMAAALKQLARDTSTNLLVDNRALKEAQTAVTLQLEDVPLETAVRLLAEMAGLKPVRVGNVLFVTTKTNAAEMRADVDLVPPQQPGQPQPDVMVPGGIALGAAPAAPAVAPRPPAANPPAGDKTEPPPADKEKTDKDAKPPDKDTKPDKEAKPEPPKEPAKSDKP